jgi:hypothetical protein
VRGECYTTGERWHAGDSVTVRYRPGAPAVCCIEGARLNEVGWVAAIVLLFPAMGVAIVAWVIVTRRRAADLLENGFLAEALVTDIAPTVTRINGRAVQAITLQRTDSADGGTLTVHSLQPEVITFARERMEARQSLFVLYDPAKPKSAMLPEAL